jgi:hypothetical protein
MTVHIANRCPRDSCHGTLFLGWLEDKRELASYHCSLCGRSPVTVDWREPDKKVRTHNGAQRL